MSTDNTIYQSGIALTGGPSEAEIEEHMKRIVDLEHALTTTQSQLKEALEKGERLNKALWNDQPYNVIHILNTLCDAVDHLFEAHDCDGHGWEAWKLATGCGREIAQEIQAALAEKEGGK